MTGDLKKTPSIVRRMCINHAPRTVNGVRGWINYSDDDGWEVILPSGKFVWVPRTEPMAAAA